jgi:predicted KAP-like P-loop ATPase
VQNHSKTLPWELSSDLPLADPADDAFGYAPFASRLAAAIVDNKSPRGLVLAVHGRWGSGKSSVLNFVKHDLNLLPEERRPVIVDFNPWWFEGRDEIASQLLAQLAAQLPDRFKEFQQVARLLVKYSAALAHVAADVQGGFWLKKFAVVLDRLREMMGQSKKADVPSVKNEIADKLKSLGKRIVVFVDDIDRLTPDEARDFFRAVKALADFPEVVYVLFFDREEVSKALTAALKMDGEAYLEKIVQAPFNLPAVDRDQLRKRLFGGLDLILASSPMPFDFDRSRWAEVYWHGLDYFIQKPRDVVRILNAISVSYPSVAGEVNLVDFIALEVLRLFAPSVYGSIRDSKAFFCGAPTQLDGRKEEQKAYFERWKEALPAASREQLAELVGRLFPKVAHYLGTGMIWGCDPADWRPALRPCCEDCFDVYFQFGVPSGHVSRAELLQLTAASTSGGMAALLLEARAQIRPDGHSKARDLIDRLREFDQLPAAQAAKLVEALVGHGHELLRDRDELGGFLLTSNRWRIEGLICKRLESLPVSDRRDLLMRLVESSPGLWSLTELADDALQAKRDPSKAPKAMLGLEDGFAEQFSKRVVARLDGAALDQLLAMPDLDLIVHRWSLWGDTARIRETFKPMLAEDDSLIILLDKFVRTGLRHSGRSTTETYQLSFRSLDVVMDVKVMEARIRHLQSRADLSRRVRAATKQFILGLEATQRGQDPDRLYLHDDDQP